VTRTYLLLLLLPAAAVTACHDGAEPHPAPLPVSLTVVTQPSTTAASGAQLDRQPVAELRDAQGSPAPVRGVLVSAAIGSGGGSLSGATSVRTDASGRATFTDLAIIGTAGPHTLRFTAPGLSPVLSETIALSPGAPVVLIPAAGNNQTAPAGTPLPIAPTVLAMDGAGNPVPGLVVAFSVTAGGGSVEGASPTTSANGMATLGQWTLGRTAGSNTLTATTGNAGAALQVGFSATGVVGPPSLLAVVEGDQQRAAVGAAVPIAPAVRVTDAFGNPIGGLSVSFAVASGGGSVTGGNPTSDAAGIARVGAWNLGPTPGSNTLTASRAGVSTATFTATAVDFPMSAVATGDSTACGIAAGGVLYCWGDNAFGQLGDGSKARDSLPQRVSGNLSFTAVSVGAFHACGVATGGAAYCWGSNLNGQVGDGTTQERLTPAAVTGGHSFATIAAGFSHTCGLRTDGKVLCWGAGANGRLGNGSSGAGSLVPVLVSGGYTFVRLSVGASHTCALRYDAILFCWGFNGQGRLGDGTQTDRSMPTQVLGPITFGAVTAGGAHTCGLDSSGQALCWGNGGTGALGTGNLQAQPAPISVSGNTTFMAIGAGSAHSCGVANTGAALCWGSNGSGRLGDGTVQTRLVPTAVAGGIGFSAIDPGNEFTCARSAAGSAYCWGRNAAGQLGDGTTADRLRPVGVASP